MSKTFGVFLRDTYATINNFKLDFIDDLKSQSFIRGNDLPLYIKHNNYKILDNDIISILDTNISNIYWDNRELLSITDLENLTDYMRHPSLEFDKLEENFTNIETYNINKNNVEYNVLYITVSDFVRLINTNSKFIILKLPKMDINIEIQYEPYDFYNHSTNKVDNFISR